MTRKDELYNKILRLYDEGVSALDIVKQTGLGSTATLYRILNRIGAKGRNTTDGFRVVVTLPNDLKGFVDGIEDFSKWVAKVIYMESKGLNPTPLQENFGEIKVGYRPIDPSLENVKIGMPPSAHFEGGKVAIREHGAYPYEDEAAFVDLRVIFYNNCATILTLPLCTYIDEELVKNLTLATAKEKQLDFDEVAVYNGNALLWLWHPIFSSNRIAGLEI